MANQFDLHCPKCGLEDFLDICAEIWVRLVEDGSDPDMAHNHDHHWTEKSSASCRSCGWLGRVGDLEQGDPYTVIGYFPDNEQKFVHHVYAPDADEAESSLGLSADYAVVAVLKGFHATHDKDACVSYHEV